MSHLQLQGANLSHADLQGNRLVNVQLQGANLYNVNLQKSLLTYVNLQAANLEFSNLQGTIFEDFKKDTILINNKLQGAYLSQIKYDHSINQKTKLTKSTFLLESKENIRCLTDDEKLPICDKYTPADTQTLEKITAYWINDLACSDIWIAQGILNMYLIGDNDALFRIFQSDVGAKFRPYLIPLVNKKLTDPDCLGIQNLPDDFKQQIKHTIN